MKTLKDFCNSNASRLWHGRHLKESQSRVLKFCDFGDHPVRGLDQYKPADIYSFGDYMLSEGSSANTVNHYYAAISTLFKLAVDMEFITHAPKIKWNKVRSGRPRYMSEAELVGLDTHFKDSDDPWTRGKMPYLCVIGVNTGMRLGEILKITPDCIVSRDGSDWVYLSSTKNGDDRWVPLNQKARAALEALNDEPGKGFTHRRFYNAWEHARHKIAQGDATFVFHVLRHTAATTMANDLSVNTILIAQILGHRNTSTTAKYVHSKPKVLQDIMRKLGGQH
jgi:integrase